MSLPMQPRLETLPPQLCSNRRVHFRFLDNITQEAPSPRPEGAVRKPAGAPNAPEDGGSWHESKSLRRLKHTQLAPLRVRI